MVEKATADELPARPITYRSGSESGVTRVLGGGGGSAVPYEETSGSPQQQGVADLLHNLEEMQKHAPGSAGGMLGAIEESQKNP